MFDRSPKVFLSYSWDNEDHKLWVRQLATRLVTNGVDVKLDEWHVPPGESLTQFMELQIRECDFVLVVCTPNYASRSVERKGGVGYEQQIISGAILAGSERKKFIPLLRMGTFELGHQCGIPPHFLGAKALDLRESADASSAFEAVLRAVYNEPALRQPPLGKKPNFNSLAESTPIRLATIPLDGWQLISGVASSEQFPTTFKIPAEEQRTNLTKGSMAKLMFAISIDRDESNADIERMWVRVTGERGPYITGLLANEPAVVSGFEADLKTQQERNELWGLDDHTLQYEPYLHDDDISQERIEKFERFKLRYEAEVVFLPEHILNILTIKEVAEIEMEQALRSLDEK
jgi:hypothetical protein